MDSKKIIPLLICLTALMAACGKKAFNIVFSLPPETNANYTAIFYASDKRGGMTMETVAVISQGKGELKGPAVNPTVVYLFPGKGQPIVIYAERGDNIEVAGADMNPFSWTVSGNDINKELSAWRNDNAASLAKNNPDTTNLAVARYVYAHPESQISPLLLLTSFDRKADETLFRRLWQALTPDSDPRKWADIVGRADIPAASTRVPGKLRSLALRSLATGLDTIHTDSVKATILFFWNNGQKDRSQHIDSLKVLTKEYPDSSSRTIADICLDPDSLSWRSPLRRDSLKGVVRMWAPAGMADQKLMKLGVTRSPYYLVISPDGMQRYRGSDQEDAFREFRILAGKRESDKDDK